jgi:hypothetical protein
MRQVKVPLTLWLLLIYADTMALARRPHKIDQLLLM